MKLNPNDIFKADISKISYFLEIHRPNKYQNYKYDKINSNEKIAIYYKDKHVIIGFRGTLINSISDLQSDMFIVFNIMYRNKHFKESERLFRHIVLSYKNYKIELTGHSLGGSIALYLNNIPDLKNIIYSTTLFNPAITPFSYQKHIIERYAENKKNKFIIQRGDNISNNIIKYNPKNMILFEEPIYKKLIQNHTLNLFISDKMKLYNLRINRIKNIKITKKNNVYNKYTKPKVTIRTPAIKSNKSNKSNKYRKSRKSRKYKKAIKSKSL